MAAQDKKYLKQASIFYSPFTFYYLCQSEQHNNKTEI